MEKTMFYKSLDDTRIKSLTEKRIEACFSSDKVDRDSDVIKQNWVIRKRKGDKLPLLFGHNRDVIIGFADLTTFRKELNGDLEESVIEIEFDELTEISKTAKKQFENYVLGLSIGFIPVQYSFEEKVRDGQKGLSVFEAELLEISVVSIPSNTDAQRKEFIRKVTDEKAKETGNYIKQLEAIRVELQKQNYIEQLEAIRVELQNRN